MSISASSTVPLVRRPLTDGEFTNLAARINAAGSVGELLTVAITGVFDTLLADVGQSLADVTARSQIDPTQYAIPSSQWQALLEAVTHRADQWGCGPMVALELVNVFPSSYDDPAVAVPILEQVDHRPVEVRICLSRAAADEIAACEAHLGDLARCYGLGSPQYLDAYQSWHRCLMSLLSAHHGPDIRIARDGRLSLLVTTASLTFGVIFRGQHRGCQTSGCQAIAATDGRWYAPYREAPVLDHAHVPAYPFTGPQPGHWSLHS